MEVFVLSFVIIALAVFGLAVGTLFRGSVLKGSCGGLGATLGARDSCEFCETPCDEAESDRHVPGNVSALHPVSPDTMAMVGAVRDP